MERPYKVLIIRLPVRGNGVSGEWCSIVFGNSGIRAWPAWASSKLDAVCHKLASFSMTTCRKADDFICTIRVRNISTSWTVFCHTALNRYGSTILRKLENILRNTGCFIDKVTRPSWRRLQGYASATIACSTRSADHHVQYREVRW
jgi:hypothetical protein